MNNVTVLIISSGKFEYLKENINSLIKFNSEIFVVVNGFKKNTVDFLTRTKNSYAKIDYLILYNKIPKSQARNIGVKSVVCEIIYFMDDDAFIQENNVEIISEKFDKYPSIGVLGGPNLTPPDSNGFQTATGIMFSTYLLSWKMSRRYLPKGSDRYTDDSELILCNLAVKKSLFEKYNLNFEKILHYNEENLLIEQLKKNNVKILYSPDLKVFHHRRKSLFPFILQVFNSGKGRALMTFFMPSSLRVLHLFPSLFVLYISALLFGKMTFILLLIYILLSIYNVLSALILYNKPVKDCFLLFIIAFVSHLSYGIGFIAGIIQGSLWKIMKRF